MKRTIFSFLFFTLSAFNLIQAQNHMQVKGRFLYDACGEKVVLRGVNEMFIWSNDLDGIKTMPEIAETGANVVRIVWLSDEDNVKGSPANLDAILINCIAHKMFPMPELHGATGDFSKLQKQVDYWTRPEVVDVLKKHEAYLLVNIANEAGDKDVTQQQFREQYQIAIRRIRETGLRSPLVIDASNWGQDIDILQSTGPSLLEADSLDNLLFSVHMWWPASDGSRKRIKKEIKESVKMELPLIVGEFAPMAVKCAEYIDYKTIMKQCEKYDIGWMAWSWGLVDNSDCELMDMTSNQAKGRFSGLFDWGYEVAVNNKNSIKNTSKKTYYLNHMACP